VTLEDVAREVGVSAMTVSRVVRGMDKRVTDETTKQVQAVIDRLGYQPDMVAKGLRGDPTRAIGLMLSRIGGYFFGECVGHIDALAQNAGYSLILAGSHEYAHSELDQFQMLMARRIDGLLVIPTPGRHQFLKTARVMGFPIVAFEREVPDVLIDSVYVENRAGAKRAVEHLLQHGHRRIACVSNESAYYTITDRIRGYQEAMHEAGLEALLLQGSDKARVGVELSRALQAIEPPTALFTTNGDLSLQVLEVLAAHRLSVPKDIAIIGFDDFAAAPYLSTPMTTIRLPIKELGTKAFELLLKRMTATRRVRASKIALPTELVVRQSCGCPIDPAL
jgi:LacI family transcriptional regulator